MGKQTVESCPRIDAHFWATEPIRRLASALAQCFADAWPRLQAGASVKRTGLVPMRWTRGPQKVVIGSIRFGVGEAEGDKVCRLLLVASLPVLPKTSPQEIRLDWHTATGGEAALPVFLCPLCGKRCRYLYQRTTPQKGSSNQKGSARAELFACRLCAGLCYAGQLKSRSRSGLSGCLSSLSNNLLRSRLLSEEAVTEVLGAVRSITEFQQKCAERFQAIEKEKSHGVQAIALNRAAKPTVHGDVQPGSQAQPHPQEQPAKILPGSEIVKPKRPAGRPKERRHYNGRERKKAGCAGQLALNEGYCVGCRARRQIVNATPFVASNRRPGIKGWCAECGRGLCRMGKSNQGDIVASYAGSTAA